MVMLFYRHANKQGGEHRKHVRLDERHQEFEHINKECESDADWGNAISRAGAEYVRKREDEPDKAQNHQVTSSHVGEKSNSEGDGLRKDTQDFNRHEDRLDKRRDPRRPENVHPIIFGTAHLRQNKREGGQDYRNHQIRRSRRTKGNETEKITGQNKEERRQEIRQILVCLVTQVWPRNIIANKHNQRFEQVLE